MASKTRSLSSLACLLLGGALNVHAETLSLRLHGSNTLGARLAPALLQAYARQQGYLDVQRAETAPMEFQVSATRPDGARFVGTVRAHGTGTGHADLVSGAADVWMASRAATAAEVEAARSIGALHTPAQEHVVALDGLAIIVHSDNPLGELRIDQVRDAFAGRLSDWAQLGGQPGPIHLYARDDQSGTFDTFKATVLDGNTPLAAQTRRFESSSELERSVATDPSALGFVGFSYVASTRALAVHASGTLPLNPDALSISTEDYALARRLYFYTARDAGPAVRAFVEFVQAGAGQAVVAETGFVAQQIFAAAAEPLPGNPDGYYEVIGEAARVSLNFRFSPASSTLDSRALRDIERLREFMQRPENQHKEIRLAAFSPGTARSPMMTLLTLNDRVDHISQLLAVRGVPIGTSRGFIHGALLAPSDRSDSRVRNERVEVWLAEPAANYSGDGPM